jgi:glycerophosphoryl diester phosphodiesterase
LKVFVWTVNHLEEMKEMASRGADGFFTDFPQRAAYYFRPENVGGGGGKVLKIP